MPCQSNQRKSLLFAMLVAALAAAALAPSAVAQSESTTEPRPREGGWKQMHESFLARAKAKPKIDLLFLGDSITQGWSGARGIWDRHYGPRNAANFGIGGDRTQHVLWRIENGEVDAIQPKVVVLMIGTNNVGHNPPDQIANGIEAIVKKLHEKLPETKVLLLGVFPRDQRPTDTNREQVNAVNDKIARLDNGKTVKYLDISKSFMNEDGTVSPDIMPDFVHLTRKGYRLWADAMEPTLWSMLDEK